MNLRVLKFITSINLSNIAWYTSDIAIYRGLCLLLPDYYTELKYLL